MIHEPSPVNNELLYQLSLTLINGIGPVQAKQLIEHFGNAENIFKAKKKELGLIENIGEIRAKQIKDFDNFKEAENEINFCEKHHIETLFITDKNYPQRLLNCYDSPTLLFYRGNADLNTSKIISIIGTRNNTDYGKQITEQFIEDIQSQNLVILSGLAFGIDAIAHKSAVKNNISTVAVLAHGLDIIYPSQHQLLAKEILLNGGLLTEFRKNTNPDKHNFPKRNRIVAGMCDATIVIETAVKGGSMITAELAYNYNRDVFAVPGKITDNKSGGCLKLIQQNKAIVFTNAQEFMHAMGWQQKKIVAKKQRELFIELSDDEKIIVDILKEKESVGIDEIYFKSTLSSSSVAAAILNLELQNVIAALPGKMYMLL
ncbi:MAG TPA: DNA-processing protein DprA [Chitinophagaceae bacterium]|nr:DNA-processing protein DprA [Chitinophagaceae bacterium]